ncbi:TonB-dependent receptor domain-containing protein [Flavobacterium chuncheonense]|uniref:TonB-dependent receptor domain-containing protein n=1 Tax=Flavobacterium chuncheonense TaxID=2026653 RepID=A0ABW5YLY0_9FLAO
MKHYIIQIAFILMAISTYSQYQIKGKITSENNLPLQNVALHLLENNASTETNENGEFEFKEAPKGNITIVTYLFGYEQQNITLNTTAQNELNIILVEKEQHLDEVIVSTNFNKVQSQNVMKVEHRNVEELRKNGATSLIEGLATIPGVNQISTGTSIGKPVIRGLSSNRVLTYTQGVRLENQQFGDEHGLGLSASGIESVEIIKGPAALLYGSDALGGVLYLNPEKYAQADKTAGSFTQQFSSNTQGTNTSLGYKFSPNNWKFLIRANYNSQADYKIPDGDRIINTRSIEKDIKTGIGYSSSTFSTDIRYNYNNLNLGLPEEEITNLGFRTPLYPNQKIDNHIVSWNQKIFFKNSKIDADFGYQQNNRQELEAPEEIALHMKLQTLNYNVKYYLPQTKGIKTIVGTQGMHQVNTNFGEELLIPDATTVDFGAFITSQLEWKNNALQAGFRFDNRAITTSEHGILNEEGYFSAIDKNFNSINFALGYKTVVLKNVTTRLNLASGFRAPNLSELTSNGVHEGSNRYEIGNQNLENEKNIQIDLNVEYQTEHFELYANGFYNKVDNYIYLSPTGMQIEDNFVFEYQQNNAALYGGEFGIHIHPHPFDWLHFTSSFETVTGKQENDNYLPLIPANQWKNNIKTEFNIKNWLDKGYALLQVNHTFAQDNTSTFETSTPDYTLVNIGIGGTIKWNKRQFNVNLNANNLLDKNYIAHLSRLKADNIPNMGRNILLGINFNF